MKSDRQTVLPCTVSRMTRTKHVKVMGTVEKTRIVYRGDMEKVEVVIEWIGHTYMGNPRPVEQYWVRVYDVKTGERVNGYSNPFKTSRTAKKYVAEMMNSLIRWKDMYGKIGEDGNYKPEFAYMANRANDNRVAV